MVLHRKEYPGKPPTVVIYDDYENISYMCLKDGPYLTAGRKYGWHPPIGLGISRKILDGCMYTGSKLRIFVTADWKKAYQVSPEAVLDFSKSHSSIEMKGEFSGTELRIIQFSQEHFRTILGVVSFKEILCHILFDNEEAVKGCILKFRDEDPILQPSMDSFAG